MTTFVRVLMLAALFPGCSEYGLQGRKDRDATDTGVSFAVDTAGLLDSGPSNCDAPAGLADAVSVAEACVTDPVLGTLDTVVEWDLASLNVLHEYGQVLMTPVVGPLTDGDGDGDVDADDPPSVVVVADDGGTDDGNNHGVMQIVDGRSGRIAVTVSRVDWGDTQVFPYRYSNVALGDIDGDGTPEIVAVVTVVGGPPGEGGGEDTDTNPPEEDTGGGGEDTDIVVRPSPPPGPPPVGGGPCRVAAYAADGTLRWLAEAPELPCGSHAPALADLEGDGAVEVIVGANVFEGATGAVRFSGASGAGRPPMFHEAGWMSFAVDLDGDGAQEVVTGSTVYDADGGVVCETGEEDGFPAVADLDGDNVADLVVVTNGWLRVFDATCTPKLAERVGDAGVGGPASIGDLDGDGLPEIGVASAGAYTVFEADGRVVWSIPISDASSSSTGSAFFDFDGDGILKVVYADEVALWLVDGATGVVRMRDDTHSSRTLHEYPVIVDVDGDGATEIVVPNGGSHSDAEALGLYVLGSADGSWPTNRRVWNQHAYAVTNIDDDLSVPASPMPNWPTYNTFRSGTVDPVSGGSAPDAVPVAEVCDAQCVTGTWVADVRVGNTGLAGLRTGVPVTLYVGEAAVETRWTTAVVASGGVSETFRFTLEASTTRDEVRVAVDDDGGGVGRVTECDEVNNVLALAGCE